MSDNKAVSLIFFIIAMVVLGYSFVYNSSTHKQETKIQEIIKSNFPTLESGRIDSVAPMPKFKMVGKLDTTYWIPARSNTMRRFINGKEYHDDLSNIRGKIKYFAMKMRGTIEPPYIEDNRNLADVLTELLDRVEALEGKGKEFITVTHPVDGKAIIPIDDIHYVEKFEWSEPYPENTREARSKILLKTTGRQFLIIDTIESIEKLLKEKKDER